MRLFLRTDVSRDRLLAFGRGAAEEAIASTGYVFADIFVLGPDAPDDRQVLMASSGPLWIRYAPNPSATGVIDEKWDVRIATGEPSEFSPGEPFYIHDRRVTVAEMEQVEPSYDCDFFDLPDILD